MLSLRRKPAAAVAVAAEGEETWADSALWGATFALLVVILLLCGVGYIGYASLERPATVAASAAASTSSPAATTSASAR